MPQYRFRPRHVEAVRYAGQAVTDLPKWAQDYTQYVPLQGITSVVRTTSGRLLLPTPDGNVVKATFDNWLVWDGKVIHILNDDGFAEAIEEIAEETAPPTPEAADAAA